jgi:hypothetical protein
VSEGRQELEYDNSHRWTGPESPTLDLDGYRYEAEEPWIAAILDHPGRPFQLDGTGPTVVDQFVRDVDADLLGAEPDEVIEHDRILRAGMVALGWADSAGAM